MVQECVSPAAVKGAASGFTSRPLSKCALNAWLLLGGGSRPSFQSMKTFLILFRADLSLHGLLNSTWPSIHHMSIPKPCRDIRNCCSFLYLVINKSLRRSWHAFECQLAGTGKITSTRICSTFWLLGWFEFHDFAELFGFAVTFALEPPGNTSKV
jgi:hypothetical protein